MTGAALTTLRGRPPRPVDGTRTSTGFWILNKSVAFLRVESSRGPRNRPGVHRLLQDAQAASVHALARRFPLTGSDRYVFDPLFGSTLGPAVALVEPGPLVLAGLSHDARSLVLIS
jgi:hypothetical protein